MSITWITTADVEEAVSVSVQDADWLASCTEAAQDWAFRRRAAAGYTDDEAEAPSASVKLGAVLYAAALYAQRAAVDGFQSFEQIGATIPTGSMGQVERLLGIGRPAVA